MLGQPKAEKPELSHTWPRENAPSFVSLLVVYPLAISFRRFPSVATYYAIDVGFNLFWGDLAVGGEKFLSVRGELISQKMMIPRPGDASCAAGHWSIQHFGHGEGLIGQHSDLDGVHQSRFLSLGEKMGKVKKGSWMGEDNLTEG